MIPEIVLKPEAGFNIGFGHALRLVALCEYLRDNFLCQLQCLPIPQELKQILSQKNVDFKEFPDEERQLDWLRRYPDRILVLDGYNFSPSTVAQYKKFCSSIVKIDDMFELDESYDVVVNHSPGATRDKYPGGNQILALGTDYLMVRKAFLTSDRTRTAAFPPEKIFICFGASDPGDVTRRVVETLGRSSPLKELHVVSAFEKTASPTVTFHHLLNDSEMIRLMSSCDLAICAPSTVSLEVCCIGLPLIVIQTADNQSSICEGLQRKQAAWVVQLNEIEAELLKALDSLQEADMVEILFKQRELVDRKASQRFQALFEQL